MSLLPQLERDLIEVARRRLPGEAAAVTRSGTGGRRIRLARRSLPLGRLVPVLSVAVAVAIAVIAVGSLRHGRAPVPSLRAPVHTPYAVVDSLVGAVPQSGATLGSRQAPVRVVLYGDLECPMCRALVLSRGFTRLIDGEVRTGRAQITYRPLCTTTCDARNPQVFDEQQAAADAAGRQGLFWQYALLFFREQRTGSPRYVTARYLTGLAEQIRGLNLRRWQTERRSPGLLGRVAAEQAAAAQAGVLGTPTLRFQGPKAVLVLASSPSPALIDRAVRIAEHGCPPHWRALGLAHCRDLV